MMIMLGTRPFGSIMDCAVRSISFRNFLVVTAGQNASGIILPIYCTIILRLSYINSIADESLQCYHYPTAEPLSNICFVQVLRAVSSCHPTLCGSCVGRTAHLHSRLFRAQVCSAKRIETNFAQLSRIFHYVDSYPVQANAPSHLKQFCPFFDVCLFCPKRRCCFAGAVCVR